MVGGTVVVVGGTVDTAVGSDPLVVVVELCGRVVEVGAVAGRFSGTLGFADPGCSWATTAPISTTAPVTATTMLVVRRRILVTVRWGDAIGVGGRRFLRSPESTSSRSISFRRSDLHRTSVLSSWRVQRG